MSMEEALTRWTVRLAMLGYAVALILRCVSARQTHLAWARIGWTLGFVLFLVHVWCAFEFYHDWSHSAAVLDTARQTRELLGVEVGAGIWGNYLFLLVWLVDVGWWWLGVDRYEARPRWVEMSTQGFLGFIAFNATVVFVSGVMRWVAVSGWLVVFGVWWFVGRANRPTR